MNDDVARHCAEIDRCNQRGGRMLSVVDLIDAETFTPELAAYALAAIGRGASFMVGAAPGGAGKTTVMGALLNLVPAKVQLAPADAMAAIRRGLQAPDPPQCFICHEIGRGSYYAYLWGAELRAYFDLPAAGHMLATNLHADTIDQAHGQICGDCNVSEDAFAGMKLMFFLAVRRAGLAVRRRIASVWESDGSSPHRQVFQGGSPFEIDASALVDPEAFNRARRRVDELLAGGGRTIEDVRSILASDGGE
ncbi:hypothetical protein LCGC14_2001730 [marine sediment metagenome]|uniref:Bacterial type II secretion system protein E domain-containing protein n=1 Tax=marine sediment metagenome TaxID=412755 RepID=A0A0F9HGF0_9ZZZZ